MPTEGTTTATLPEESAAVDGPSDLSGPSKRAVVRRAAKEFRNDNLTTIAAALTYYAVLSVVAGLIVLISLVGLVGHNVATRVTSQVESLVPGSSAAFLHSLVSQAQHHKGGAGITAIVGLVIALELRQRLSAGVERHLWHWRGSADLEDHSAASRRDRRSGRGTGRECRHRRGERTRGEPGWQRSRGRPGGCPGLGRRVMARAPHPHLGPPCRLVLGQSQCQAGGYSMDQPRRDLRNPSLSGSFGALRPLRDELPSYEKTYGSLAGVVVFLVRLWLTNVALLLGAEVNAEFEHARAIACGLPEDVRPFAEPRDTRSSTKTIAKLSRRPRRPVAPEGRRNQFPCGPAPWRR